MSANASNPDAVLDEVVTALRRDDLPRAERAMAAAPGAVSNEALLRLAELNMRRRRWRDAAWLFDQIPGRLSASDLKRCLSRNLAALEEHRPEIYAVLTDLPQQDMIMICPAATGRPTIGCRRADGGIVVMSPGNDPLAAMASGMTRLKPTLADGQAVALCGMADGYVLHALARDVTPLFLNMQQPVFVFEPDPQLALHCLMIHDYSGPAGPIEQKRFWWFVGPLWAADFESAVERDPFIGIPAFMLGMGLGSGAMQAILQEVVKRVVDRDTETAARIKRYYDSINPAEGAALFGVKPARKPRVLLVTTVFSTVLQYSTRDSADAFDRIGWEARVLIEPSPAHRLYQIAIRRIVDEFKPDLVFQIDHLRYEHGEMFPPNLPFACWVQDHLLNLQNKVAGPSVTERDFVLTDAGPVYSATFGYPPRQLIGLAKLTRGEQGSGEGSAECLVLSSTQSAECSVLSAEKKTRTPEGQAASLNSALSTQHSALSATPSTQHSALRRDDLVFVSNASYLPLELIETKRSTYNGSEDGRTLLAESGRRLVRLYDDGGSVSTWFGLLDFVRAIRRELMLQVPDRELESFSAWLFHPLNNALYRHQALLWAADAADELGLTLGVYGKGWDKHPQLGRHARGPVEYGAALDELSRRSRFNLQIVPFLCLHQRLLDGLVAGGFYLIRSHPADRACSALLDFLNGKIGKDARNLSSARSAVPIEQRRHLEQLIQACVPSVVTTDRDDPVEIIRSWEEIGLLVPGKPVLARLDETTFSDAAELRQRIARFVADPSARDQVLAAQRKDMLERFTYEAGMRRITARMGQLLEETARSTGRAAA